MQPKKKTKVKNLGGYLWTDRAELKEIDYLDKLSPEELAWYNQFLDEHYNARYKAGHSTILKPEQLKEANRAKQKRMQDAYSGFKVNDSEGNTNLLFNKAKATPKSPANNDKENSNEDSKPKEK